MPSQRPVRSSIRRAYREATGISMLAHTRRLPEEHNLTGEMRQTGNRALIFMNLHSKRCGGKKTPILIYFVSSRFQEDLCLFEHKDCLTSKTSTSVARFVRSLTPLTGIKLERDTTGLANKSTTELFMKLAACI